MADQLDQQTILANLEALRGNPDVPGPTLDAAMEAVRDYFRRMDSDPSIEKLVREVSAKIDEVNGHSLEPVSVLVGVMIGVAIVKGR